MLSKPDIWQVYSWVFDDLKFMLGEVWEQTQELQTVIATYLQYVQKIMLGVCEKQNICYMIYSTGIHNLFSVTKVFTYV